MSRRLMNFVQLPAKFHLPAVIILTTAISVLGGSGLFFTATQFAETYIRNKLAQEFGRLLDLEVRLDEVRFGLDGSLTLSNIQAVSSYRSARTGQKKIIQALWSRKIKIAVAWKKLLNNWHNPHHWLAVELTEPFAYISLTEMLKLDKTKADTFQLEDLKLGQLTINDGSLVLEHEDFPHSFTARHIKGSCYLGTRMIKGKIESAGSAFGHLAFNASARYVNPVRKSRRLKPAAFSNGVNKALAWNASLDVSDLDVSYIPKVINRRRILPEGATRGKVNIAAKLNRAEAPDKGLRRLPLTPTLSHREREELTNWNVSLDSTEPVKWLIPGTVEPVVLQGSLEFTPPLITIKSLTINDNVKLTGNIDRPFQYPIVSLNMTSDKTSVNRLKRSLGRLFPAYLRPANGNLSAKAKLLLSKAGHNLSGDFNYNGYWGPVHIPTASGSFSGNAGNWEATVNAFSGTVHLTKSLLEEPADSALKHEISSPPALNRLHLTIQNIALEDLSEANNLGPMTGKFSGNFNLLAPQSTRTESFLESKIAGVSARGFFKVNKFGWRNQTSTATFTCNLKLRKGNLDVGGFGDSLTVKGLFTPTAFVLKKAVFKPAAQETTSASGILEYGGKINVNVSGESVALEHIPFLVARYPEIRGRLNYEAKITGYRKAPEMVIKGNLTAFNFKNNLPGESGTFQLSLERQNRLNVAFALNREMEGTVSISKKKMSALTLKANRVDVKLIGAAMGLTIPLEGQLDGQLSFTAPAGKTRVEVNSQELGAFTWSDGKAGALNFRMLRAKAFSAVNGNGVMVKFDAEQDKGGSLISQVEYNKGAIRTRAQMTDFFTGGLFLDGKLYGTGTINLKESKMQFTVDSPDLTINGQTGGKGHAEIYAARQILTFRNVKWGDNSTAQLLINLKSGSIDGRWAAERMDIGLWLKRLKPQWKEVPSGFITATGKISGFLKEPTIRVVISLNEGTWHNVPFGANGEITLAGSTVTLDTLNITAGQNTRAVFSGQLTDLNKGSMAMIDIKTKTLEFSLSEIIKWLGLENLATQIKGQGKSELFISGALAKPNILGRISGRHLRLPGPVRTFKSWKAEFTYEPFSKILNVVKMDMRTATGRLFIISRFDFAGPGVADFKLYADTRNIHIKGASLFGGAEMDGSITKDTKGGLILKGDLVANSLWVNQQRLDGNLARLFLDKERIEFLALENGPQKISGKISLGKLPRVDIVNLVFKDNESMFTLDGAISPDSWDFASTGTKLDVRTLLGIADVDIPVEGKIDFKVTGMGSGNRKTVTGTVSGNGGSIWRLPFDQLSGNFRLERERWEFYEFKLMRKDGYLVTGKASLPPLTAGGKISGNKVMAELLLEDGKLSVLKDLWPDVTSAKGKIEGYLKISSKNGNLIHTGELKIKNGFITSKRYFDKIRDINVEINLDRDEVTLKKLFAFIGHGRLIGEGKLQLDNLEIAHYDLHLYTEGKHGITINIPQLAMPPGAVLKRFSLLREKLASISRGEPKFDLRLDGPAGSHTVSGKVELVNTIFTYPPPRDGKKTRLRIRSSSWLMDFLRNTFWDIALIAGERAWYENALVYAEIYGHLTFNGRHPDIAVNGELTTERGTLSYLGWDFKIQNAVFEVVTTKEINPVTGATRLVIIPYVQGIAEREIKSSAGSVAGLGESATDVATMIISRSPLGKIAPTFKSREDPSLSSEKVLERAFGIPHQSGSADPEETRRFLEERDRFLRAGMVQLLDTNLTSPLARVIARQTGLVDYIGISYEEPENAQQSGNGLASADLSRPGWLEYLRGTKVSLGRELTKRIFASYIFKVDEFQNKLDLRHEVEIAYRVRGNLFVRASSQLDTERTLGRPPEKKAVIENKWRFRTKWLR